MGVTGWWAEVISGIVATARSARASMSGGSNQIASLSARLQSATAALGGVIHAEGNLAAQAHPALAALSGGQAQRGDIAAASRPATAALVGKQTQQGTVSAAARPAAAALVGRQTQQGAAAATLSRALFSGGGAVTSDLVREGDIAAVLRAATAALSGGHAQSGPIAATARAATASMAGALGNPGVMEAAVQRATASMSGSQRKLLEIIGTPIAINGNSAALPTHDVGDLIVLFLYRRTDATTAIVKPAAAGTVPAWVDIDNNAGANACASRAAQFVATSNDHTSGSWTGAEVVSAIVIRNQGATPIGGHAESGGTGTSSIAPAITMSQTDGTSMVLHFHATRSNTTWVAAPAGYTRRAAYATLIGGVCLNTKDDTTSDGSISQGNQTSSGYRGQTIEIRNH